MFSYHLINSARSHIAADASALAGIYGGAERATEIARANMAQPLALTDKRETNGTFTVVVSVGMATTTAQAFDQWSAFLPTLIP
jgi:hypothetical protein